MSGTSVVVQYDAQLLAWQHRGGISNYFANIVAEFDRDPRLGVRATGVPQYTLNQQAIDLGMGRRVPGPVPHRVRAIRAINSPRQAVDALRGRDAVHYTYYANRRLRPGRGAASVVTVYDMIPELFPELFPAGNPHQHKLAHVAAADSILCISETTRDDLLNLVPGVADRIRVTPLGVSSAYFEQPVTTRGSGRPYLLYVGMRTFHKNFDVVARAMARAHPDLELVLAGGGPLTSAEQMRLQELGLADRVRQLTPSDEDLRALYRSALAFVFSSRYEGFGLPVIEAMASGCPTLLASTAVFREIAGDDAEYFAPDDEDALAAAIDRMVDDSHRTSLIARGRLRAAEFTWTRTAAATAAAYRAVRDA